mgnify:CR=1 FL=1
MIETNKRRIVIEFKYAKNETEAKAKLSEAVEQIKSRDYGNIVPRKDGLLRIAAVFNADPKVRAFTQYKFVQSFSLSSLYMKDLNFLRSFLFPTIILLLYFDALFCDFTF